MRYVLYGLLFLQCFVIVILTKMMVDRPFSNSDMGKAYGNGCRAGQHYINAKSFACNKSAKQYEDYLSFLDSVMDKESE